MELKQIGGFIIRSAAVTLVADGVRRAVRKIPAPTGSSTVLKFSNGVITVTGDKISTRIVNDIESFLRTKDCEGATISIRKKGNVVFSRVPEKNQQRIRNLLNS
ncbi:DUF3634 family protein [Akkermansiaceae bacterium]|nr:DUF3634 family protein [Akkermansiaceae bacterium]